MRINILLFAALFFSAHAFGADSFQSALRAHGVEAPAALNIKIARKYSDPGGIYKTEFMFGEAAGTYIRAELTSGVSEAFARKQLREKELQLDSVYEGVEDPYFLAVTKKSACPPEFKLLKKKPANSLILYSAFANKNRAVGLCVKADIGFMVEMANFYCKEKGVLVFIELQHKLEKKIPTPKDRQDSLAKLNRLRCS